MKNQYELLNEAWIDFSNYEEMPLSEQEREQMMKKFRQTSKRQRRKQHIMYAAACAASLALVSQTAFAKDLVNRIISIGNSSIVIYEEDQTEVSRLEKVPEELEGRVFDADGNMVSELTDGQKLYNADGREVMITADTGNGEVTYSLNEAAEPAVSERTVVFSSEEELEENLSFDLKIPASLPEGYKLDTAYTYQDAAGNVSGDYAMLAYSNGSQTFYIHERRDSEETRYSDAWGGAKEMEFHDTTAAYDDHNFMCSWDGTIIDILGNQSLTGDALLEVANSLE